MICPKRVVEGFIADKTKTSLTAEPTGCVDVWPDPLFIAPQKLLHSEYLYVIKPN